MHVDITDLEIVDYIQRDPTISLKEISKEIGLSESTVQRRWRRLTGEGLAWTGAALHPSASAGLFIKFSVQESHLASLLYKNDWGVMIPVDGETHRSGRIKSCHVSIRISFVSSALMRC